MEVATVEGPAWCAPGLTTRSGVYPLAVEQPVLNRVSLLVPGVTSLTTIARYYSFYWALAELAGSRNLDAPACRKLVRNAEVALAWASALDPETGNLTGARSMHGADTVYRLLQQGRDEHLANVGTGSYSTRSWGYWSQYRGSSLVLKIAAADGYAIRRGARPCPTPIKQMYEPLLQVCAERAPRADDISGYVALTCMNEDSPDVEPLRELLSATVMGVHSPDDSLPPDIMRRSTLRILARSAQVCPSYKGWRFTLADGVAYGDRIEGDPGVRRGTSTGGDVAGDALTPPLRRGVARAVVCAGRPRSCVRPNPSVARNSTIGFGACVGARTVSAFVDGLPPVEEGGHPAPAEDHVNHNYSGVEASIGVLLLGAFRLGHLDGEVLSAFLGGSAQRRVYLDPHWVTANTPSIGLARWATSRAHSSMTCLRSRIEWRCARCELRITARWFCRQSSTSVRADGSPKAQRELGILEYGQTR